MVWLLASTAPRSLTPLPKNWRALLLVFVAASLAFAAPASAAVRSGTAAAVKDPGGIGVQLLDAPLAANDDPRARIYIVDHLAPGTVIQRRIQVTNTTHSTQRVALYAAAATVSNGSFLGSAAHTPNELSTWTTVTPAKAEVPAGGSVTATVTINVPRDAAPGEQYGVVWAETRSSSEHEGAVVEVSRVGIRLYVSVGPGGAPAADFTIDSLTAQRSADGQPLVVASVHNTGGRALDMNGVLELGSGPGGLSAGPFPATLGVTLGIDDIEPVTIVLDEQIPAGPWDARITLHSGLLDRTASATITFPDAGSAAPVTTSSQRPVWLSVLGACLIALVFALLTLFLTRRWRHPRPPGMSPQPDTVTT